MSLAEVRDESGVGLTEVLGVAESMAPVALLALKRGNGNDKYLVWQCQLNN
jgi:hypothetical protein